MNQVLKKVDQLRDPVNIFNYIPLNYHGRGETKEKGTYEKKCIIELENVINNLFKLWKKN